MTDLKRVSFEELMSKSYLAKFDKEVEGVGVLTLTELSNAESLQLMDEARALDAERVEASDAGIEPSESDHVSHIRKWAVRFLKGSAATEDEIASIGENLGTSACMEVYYAGVNFRGNSEKAEHEKN